MRPSEKKDYMANLLIGIIMDIWGEGPLLGYKVTQFVLVWKWGGLDLKLCMVILCTYVPLY